MDASRSDKMVNLKTLRAVLRSSRGAGVEDLLRTVEGLVEDPAKEAEAPKEDRGGAAAADKDEDKDKDKDNEDDDDDEDDDVEHFPSETEEGSSSTGEEESEVEDYNSPDNEDGEAVDNLERFCGTLAKIEQVNLCLPRILKLPGVLGNLRDILHEMTGLEKLGLDIFEVDNCNALPSRDLTLGLLNQVLENSQHVKTLHLTTQVLSQQLIKTIVCMSALTDLELGSNWLKEVDHDNHDGAGPGYLSSLAGLTQLKRLRVSPSSGPACKVMLGPIAWMAQMTDLVSLGLHFQHGAQPWDASLRERLSGPNEMRDVTLCPIAIAALTALEELELRNMRDTPFSQICPAVAGLCRLRIMDLHCCQIGDKGAGALAGALCTLSSLTTLDVGMNWMRRRGVQSLGRAMCALTTLTLLDMSSNDVGDEGASTLAGAVRRLSSLRVLRLDSAGIRDAGAIALAGSLCGATKLGEIDLAWNNFGIPAVLALVKVLLNLPDLHTVNLGYSAKPDSELFGWTDGEGNALVPAEVLAAGWAASLRFFREWNEGGKTAEWHARSGLAGLVALRAEAAEVASARAQCKLSEVRRHVQGVSELYATMQAAMSESASEVCDGSSSSSSSTCAQLGVGGLEHFARAVEGGCERAQAARKRVQASQAALRKARDTDPAGMGEAVSLRDAERVQQLDVLSAALEDILPVVSGGGVPSRVSGYDEAAAVLAGVVKSKQQQVARLAAAVEATRRCIAELLLLARTQDGGRVEGGAEMSAHAAEGEGSGEGEGEGEGAALAGEACAAYAAWLCGFDFASLGAATDLAMAGMLSALAAELPRVLQDWNAANAGEDNSAAAAAAAAVALEAALAAAGRAVDAEREAQAADHLSLARAPCKLLLAAGRALLIAREARLSGMVRARGLLSEMVSEWQHVSGLVSARERSGQEVEAVQGAVKRSVGEAEDAKDELEATERRLKRKRARGESADSEASERERKKTAWQAARDGVHRAMAKMLELEPDFPEVATGLRFCVPTSLLHLWDPARSLSSFDEQHLLSSGSASRHIVYKARAGVEWFAVKEYLLDPSELPRALNEASLLHRLRHPALAELVGIFIDDLQDTAKVYLQMPLYEHGPLDSWVEARGPSFLTVRQALLDVLGALDHLHSFGIVHADVKPANILIGAGDRARLADLDVSVDTATRTSTIHAQTKTVLAVSKNFFAPEVLSLGSSAASDMFSLGKTLAVAAVKAACDPLNAPRAVTSGDAAGAAQPQPQPDRMQPAEAAAGGGGADTSMPDHDAAGADALIALLTSEEREERPSAAEAMQHAFFRPVRRAVQREAHECCVMASDRCLAGLRIPREEGVQCGEGHFCCGACLALHVTAAMGEELRVRRGREGRVYCPKHPLECKAPPIPDAMLAGQLGAQELEGYLRSRVELAEAQTMERLEEHNKAFLASEVERLRRMDEQGRAVLAARKHVEEAILQTRCPRCSQAFLDFEGCCALACSRCGCAFCAWCLADCGTDAHAHVAACPRKPPGADRFFGTMQQVDAAHTASRRVKLAEFLGELAPAVRQTVLSQLKGTLKDRLLTP